MSNFIKQWTHKEVEVLTRSFRRYSSYVFILKFILPLTALVLIGVLFLYPIVTGKGKKIVLVAKEKTNVKPIESPVMARPKFVGMDSHKQPYQLSADKAVQERLDFTRLEKVTGDMTLENGSWISGMATWGTYDSIKHYVELNDDVSLYMVRADNSTYQATTKHAEIDMDNGIMKGDNPVNISSDSGTLSADMFMLDREKQTLTFQGNVKLKILKK